MIIPPIITEPAHEAFHERLKSLRPPTRNELRAQRRSYLRAEAGFGSDADEAAYTRAVAEGDSAKIAVFEAAAERRMAEVDRYLEAKNI
ncbi:hypothetical protein KUV57_12225 [Epibacterium sp. DP7N7-1]|nr:hypothetical protein [Epibacterium sp. DP7N7-1]